MAPAHALSPRTAGADWVFDEVARQALNSAMLYFVGTHNFHNYTNGKLFDDHEASRIVTQFSAVRTTMLKGEMFVVFRIRGQSFMLHQVRVLGEEGEILFLVRLCVHCTFARTDSQDDGRGHFNLPRWTAGQCEARHRWHISGSAFVDTKITSCGTVLATGAL